MKIAQVSPLFESVPPKYYGGTERVVSYLTEQLVAMGHDVTLYASGDSVTNARLRAVAPRSLRLDPASGDPMAHHVLAVEQVAKEARSYDLIHFHLDYLHFLLGSRLPVPHVTTLHGRLDLPELAPLYRQYRDEPLVSISNDQRTPLPWVNWQATVHHGLPLDLLPYSPGPGDYLAFLGRVSPEKRVDRAIEVARRVGVPLKIAAKVDKADADYFRTSIQPLMKQAPVEFVGEIGEAEKGEFLGKAMALLFLIDWPEPFGLVMIEALACGTPVIAWRRGSVPEVLEDGTTGFVVDSVEEATAAVRRLPEISRAVCRRVFEERFSAPIMADGYLAVYRRLLRRLHAVPAQAQRP